MPVTRAQLYEEVWAEPMIHCRGAVGDIAASSSGSVCPATTGLLGEAEGKAVERPQRAGEGAAGPLVEQGRGRTRQAVGSVCGEGYDASGRRDEVLRRGQPRS